MSELLEGLDLDQLASDVLLRLHHVADGRFELLSRETGEWRLPVHAELAFRDNETGRSVLIEVRGARGAGTLPFGMIPHIRRIKEAVAPNGVVLVSISPVPDLVRKYLTDSRIEVVDADSGDDVAPELAAAVLAAAA